MEEEHDLAAGSRWLDWMQPEAWNIEHNRLHASLPSEHRWTGSFDATSCIPKIFIERLSSQSCGDK
jgi:hypothetical protein